MRTQIAAANWKMNLTLQQGEALLKGILSKAKTLNEHQQIVFAVPAPYLQAAVNIINGTKNVFVSAQNIYNKKSGAYTGEISVEMLNSIGVTHTIIGHSERREYFNEHYKFLAEKVDIALENNITPVFCCGEPLGIREAGTQNAFVAKQLEESVFHLSKNEIKKVVIAYEPIWAIGTGKTATSQQAQDIQHHLRSLIAKHYDEETANEISILYGGSVKAANANELFSQPDIDGGLVGGASLMEDEFVKIIEALK
ncbi:triose-phosphate isomerase [Arachidicoccus ginsenosidimutans]|uniref:triose-phosphate isomerase n=1 Tax=Arachidicoccus sp. BS20 TaxID=1850526 RepID=UPI0007F098A2|nr:triose-phosphate isomerase [Arachidicoccus sp. BS20]ANI90045.1 triose-phosphate isomerase [Arachidicoccus sp. BS20]